MRMFIDTETIASQNPKIVQYLAIKSQKDNQQKLKDKTPEEQAKIASDYWLKSALNGKFGELAVISFAVDDGAPLTLVRDMLDPNGEVELLKQFSSELNAIDADYGLAGSLNQVIAHNAEFDFQFIRQRALINSVRLREVFLEWRRWVCTQKMWSQKFNDFHSLESLCIAFGIECARKEIDARNTTLIVANGGIQSLANYCESDVLRVRKLFYKLNQFKERA